MPPPDPAAETQNRAPELSACCAELGARRIFVVSQRLESRPQAPIRFLSGFVQLRLSRRLRILAELLTDCRGLPSRFGELLLEPSRSRKIVVVTLCPLLFCAIDPTVAFIENPVDGHDEITVDQKKGRPEANHYEHER